MTDGFGTAELQRTPHELFAVQFCHCATSFIHGSHGDKGKALGALRAAVYHDLRVANAADAIEEFKKIALGGIIGKIADIETLRCDVCWVGRTRLTALAWLARRTGGARFGTLGCWSGRTNVNFRQCFRLSEKPEGDDTKELLKARLLDLTSTRGGDVWLPATVASGAAAAA